MSTTHLSDESTDTLEQALLQRESVISAMRVEQAELIAELDTRQVATSDGPARWPNGWPPAATSPLRTPGP